MYCQSVIGTSGGSNCLCCTEHGQDLMKAKFD